MTASVRNPKVDAFLESAGQWREEMERLRAILLGCELIEELKWRQPCYTFQGGNIAIIQPFKKHCALMFFKGALLKDPHGVLGRPGENSQAARRLEFTSVREIAELEPVLASYVREAVDIERSGRKVTVDRTAEPAMPDELQSRLDELPALRAAFDALTPGRRRAYILHFSAARQAKTRAARVEKCIPRVLEGKGLNDR